MQHIIYKHYICSEITSQINGYINCLTFIYYYFSIPLANLIVLMIISKQIEPTFRMFLISSFMMYALVLTVPFYCLSSIQSAAHNPRDRLFSIMARKDIELKLKFKVLGLIEKLSGPVIGIYCFNLFPFSNYEMVLFYVNCVKNFMLFITLL